MRFKIQRNYFINFFLQCFNISICHPSCFNRFINDNPAQSWPAEKPLTFYIRQQFPVIEEGYGNNWYLLFYSKPESPVFKWSQSGSTFRNGCFRKNSNAYMF